MFLANVIVLPGHAQPIITMHPRDQVQVVGQSLRLEALAFSAGSVTFQWRKEGAALQGETKYFLSRTNLTPADAGAYAAVISDATGSVTSRVAQVTVDVPQTLVGFTQRWRYRAEIGEPATGWAQRDFEDAAWLEGEGVFQNDKSPLPIPRGTLLPLKDAEDRKITAHQFRTHFTFTGSTEGLTLVTTNYVDDGAVFYLNGQELGRLRLPDGPLTTASIAEPAREGYGVVMVFPSDALAVGDNVLAVELHQTADSGNDVVFGMSLHATAHAPPMPDLIPWGESARPWIDEEIFPALDCAVHEQCTLPGRRRLLRFTSESRNVGTANMVMGAPIGNPEFIFDDCHVHYHFNNYIAYRLVDAAGQVVVDGGKRSFCLEDSDRWDRAGGPASIAFDCSGFAVQGIQRGWSDIYDSILPCQYLDITGVAPGVYTLEIEVDPDHRLSELSRTNNLARVPVEIPAGWQKCAAPPSNDAFANAWIIPPDTRTVHGNSACATQEPGEPLVEGRTPYYSVWFRWIAPFTGRTVIDTEGSDFATVLGLYTGKTLAELTSVAADGFVRGPGFSSRILPMVTAGTEYRICVASLYFTLAQKAGFGGITLNLSRASNDYFVAPTELVGTRGTVAGTTVGAARELDEPLHEGELGGGSVWFAWTASDASAVVFELLTEAPEPLLSAYHGTTLSELLPIAATRPALAPAKRAVPVYPEAGGTYRLAVDLGEMMAGGFELRWRPRLELRVAPNELAGQIDLQLTALPGDRGTVEFSTDLSNWSDPRPFELPDGRGSLTMAAGSAQGFVRARLDRR